MAPRSTRRERGRFFSARRRAADGHDVRPWPGADPTLGPALFLDQLGFWDSVSQPSTGAGRGEGPAFRAPGCEVRRIPARGSASVVGTFLARHHYTAGPGMRGMPFGLFRGDALLGVAIFSRVCRPRWAAESFRLLPGDRARPPVQRRHLSVTEAEYAALSRFALSPLDVDGRPLGNGGATWFLCRCLAGLEARNRRLWSAHQRLIRSRPLTADDLRLLHEAAGADQGRGRGYVKAVTTWADPYEGMLGRIYQILRFHYTGRTNRGRWTREAVGLRSGRRLSARTLAKARSAGQKGHAAAALRLAWEGGDVRVRISTRAGSATRSCEWAMRAAVAPGAGEPEIADAVDAAWNAWKRDHVPDGAVVRFQWVAGTGVRHERFPPKHAYLTGLGSSPWYRRQTEMRHRALTDRLVGESVRRRRGRPGDRRTDSYPTALEPGEVRPGLLAALPDRAPRLLQEGS